MSDSVQRLDSCDHSAVAREQSHVYAARDRILRAAFLIDLYGVKVRSYELRELRDRVRVDGTMGVRA